MKCVEETGSSESAEAIVLYLNQLATKHLSGNDLCFVNSNSQVLAIIGEEMLFSWRVDSILNSIDFSRDETVLLYLKSILDSCRLLSATNETSIQHPRISSRDS